MDHAEGQSTITAGRTNAAAILLAAGLSQRMGSQNKLLIEIDGEPLVRRTAKTYLAAGAAVHAVLGYEAARIRAVLKDLPVSFIENPAYAEGQPSSVRAGVESLSGNFSAVIVALSDQPSLTPADILGLLDAFAEAGNFILIPYFNGRRGNPAVFPATLIAEMRALGLNAVSRDFIDRNPHLTRAYDAPNDHFVIDIDTPEDLAAFENASS